MTSLYKFDWRQLGDLAAVPFFLLLIIYLTRIPEPRTLVENLLLVFAIIGFGFDLVSVMV